MKYTIEWDESVIPSAFATEKDLQEYIATLPNAVKQREEEDHIRFNCSDTFEANSLDEVKTIINNRYRHRFQDVEYFDCKDELGKTILTEDDMEL